MTGPLRNYWVLPVALLGFVLIPTTSHATLVISLKGGTANTTLQFVDPTGKTGTSFLTENNSLNPSTVVKVDVDQQAQVTTGQAGLLAVSTTFTNAAFSFVSPYEGTEAIEINPGFGDFANQTQFTVLGYDQNNTEYSASFTITNGENRFNIESDAIQYITGVTITAPSAGAFNEIKQIRIGDVVTGITPSNPVPEPSTFAGALIGVASFTTIRLLRRRRRNAAATA